jgi:hypothetical protein
MAWLEPYHVVIKRLVQTRRKTMLTRLLLGSLAGTVLLMVWGALFWTVMPYGDDMIRAVEEEATRHVPITIVLRCPGRRIRGVFHTPLGRHLAPRTSEVLALLHGFSHSGLALRGPRHRGDRQTEQG